MPATLTLSPFLAGDPLRLPAAVHTVEDLLRAIEVSSLHEPRTLGLSPGVTLVHSLTGGTGHVTLRWVQLAPGSTLGLGEGPAEIALLLTAPLRESGVVLRLVAHLKACLGDTRLVDRAREARTREDLVRISTPVEERAGSSTLSGTDVLALLGSAPSGLSAAEAVRRRGICGPNQLEQVRRRPLPLRFLEQFTSFFAVLLWIGGAIALLGRMPELAWAVFAVIIVNGVFSFVQEYRAERAVQMLARLLPRAITVIRDGEVRRVPTSDLVPGDLVQVEEGDQVPADGQLLAAEGLGVDQSPITGESRLVFKVPPLANEREGLPLYERPELVFAGTGVMAGTGTFVVCATGMGTEIGGIAHLTQAVTEPPSPLQIELGRVTRTVTLLAVSFGAIFFALAVATGGMSLHDGLVFTLGVIVANVPEGLLPTLTLALALGVLRMARQRCLVKRLSAVETLGATTVICTDKTGTLTENRMTTRSLWVSGRSLGLNELVRDLSGSRADVQQLLEAAVLASQATRERGDPTERALLVAAEQLGVEAVTLRQVHEILAPHPFESFRKRMTLVRDTPAGPIAYVKGAPKETLRLCESIVWNGEVVPLTDERSAAILADHDRMARDGLRLLAVARRRIPSQLVGGPTGLVERDLTLLGLVALWDPPRPEVEEAVTLCQRAGIRIVIVTGDYGLTAQAIARHIGLSVRKVMTGDEFDRLRPEMRRRLLAESGLLFARTSPAHKLAIVSGLKELGEVVAVTGDGVNDAPALKAAAIGVAMGQRGSEVAKEAAQAVITDDNFATIVAAIRQGRAIYANMGKFVTYIFTHNFAELVAFLAFAFARIPLPLTVMQVLAIDLGTDLIPALALGAEPPEPGIMDQPPRSPTQRLLGAGRLLRAYAFLGPLEAALALLAFLWTYWLAGWRPGLPMVATGDLYRRATTMTLGGIVAAQVGNLFACRTDRVSVFRAGFFGNPLVLLGIAAELCTFLVILFVPPVREVFGVAPLRFAEWKLLLGFPPLMLLVEEWRKWISRTARRHR
jgi:P-type Ca2+ transporter type 2C